jgi:hypothetical protein
MFSLEVIDASGADWETPILEAFHTGRNFVTLLPAERERPLCELLGCPENELPYRLDVWAVHALIDVLEAKNYARLLWAVQNNNSAYLIEQLRIRRKQPPLYDRYILYCQARGIISTHPDEVSARNAYAQFAEEYMRGRLFPNAGVYYWSGSEWQHLLRSPATPGRD